MHGVAQRVKDAVDLGHWNPVSTSALRWPLIALFLYAPAIFLLPDDGTAQALFVGGVSWS